MLRNKCIANTMEVAVKTEKDENDNTVGLADSPRPGVHRLRPGGGTVISEGSRSSEQADLWVFRV